MRRQQYRESPRLVSTSPAFSPRAVRSRYSSQLWPTTVPQVKQRTGTIIVMVPPTPLAVGLLTALGRSAAARALRQLPAGIVDDEGAVVVAEHLAQTVVLEPEQQAAGDRGARR